MTASRFSCHASWAWGLPLIALVAAVSLVPPSTNVARASDAPTVFPASLRSVSAAGVGDAWVVGETGTGYSRTFTAHWDGGAWQRIPSPNGSAYSQWLNGVDASSSSDVWAVGMYQVTADGGYRPLILRWNGSSWSRIRAGSNPALYGYKWLTSVDAISPTDVWAVGQGPDQRTLALHWDGLTWSKVPTPHAVPSNFSQLTSVSAVSSDDLWAVGFYWNSAGASRTLILHWNGKQWLRVPSPNVSWRDDALNGVDALSPTQAWAVGWHYVHGRTHALTMRWDGTTWAIVRSAAGGVGLNAVTAISETAAWAVGGGEDHATDPATGQAYDIASWDGSGWSPVDGSTSAAGDDWVLSIDAASATDVWAVGYFPYGQSLFLHYDGSSWTVV
jgi:hypothetical protein